METTVRTPILEDAMEIAIMKMLETIRKIDEGKSQFPLMHTMYVTWYLNWPSGMRNGTIRYAQITEPVEDEVYVIYETIEGEKEIGYGRLILDSHRLVRMDARTIINKLMPDEINSLEQLNAAYQTLSELVLSAQALVSD